MRTLFQCFAILSLILGCSSHSNYERANIDFTPNQIPDYYEFEYSWTGGDGDGDVFLCISKIGVAKFTVKSTQGSHKEIFVQLPKVEVSKLFMLVESDRFLKIEGVKRRICRKNYGVYRITSKRGMKEHQVSIGETETNSDPGYFDTIIRKLQDLRPYIGPEIEWGSRSPSSYPC